jgi:hypothetical protein
VEQFVDLLYLLARSCEMDIFGALIIAFCVDYVDGCDDGFSNI